MKVLDEQTDISTQLKQTWKSDNVQEMQNFMVCLPFCTYLISRSNKTFHIFFLLISAAVGANPGPHRVRMCAIDSILIITKYVQDSKRHA